MAKAKRLAFELTNLPKKNVVPIIMAGAFYRGDTNAFDVAEDDFKVAQQNALERGLPLTIDCNHSMQGPAFGHVYPQTWFTQMWKPTEFAFEVPTLFGEVEWLIHGQERKELLDKYPFVSPVVMFNAKRMMSSRLGDAGQPIGMFIERISLVDSPFFPMPKVAELQAQFNATGGLASGFLFESFADRPAVFTGKSPTGRKFMTEEMRKKIEEIMRDESMDGTQKADAIAQVMMSYSKQTVERYTTSYVRAYAALGIKSEATEPEAFEAELSKFGAANADALKVAEGKHIAFASLEKAKVEEATQFAAKLTEAQEARAKTEKALKDAVAEKDEFIFKTNCEMKKHEAAGWDDETAKTMFTYARAEYNKKMETAKPILFNNAPVSAPVEKQPDMFETQAPMNLQEAQVHFTNEYVNAQVKAGRKYNAELYSEAMKYADNQISSFNAAIFSQK